MKRILLATLFLVSLVTSVRSATFKVEKGFTSLFDGQSLKGWNLVDAKGPGYVVENGILVCLADGGGSLLSEKEYGDFILRFDFKLSPGANNGVAIRAPMQGKQTFDGMEIQILDNDHESYRGKLQPYQVHGSLYGAAAARTGRLKEVGQWNRQEIHVQGRQVKVTLNGKEILKANINDVQDPKVIAAHPGLFRMRGHVGFLGHDSRVEFRNIRIRELAVFPTLNVPPAGFVQLWNGKDLLGWQGLGADISKKPGMSISQMVEAQVQADARAKAHWLPDNGVLVFDGKGDNLVTRNEYRNFEMWVDWKIEEKGDSGIYLRGYPQVQIWDEPEGSGGLWNNKVSSNKPLVRADRFVGDWNRFHIIMVGEKVHVFLNDQLVVRDTALENYWGYGKPINNSGPIELQNHGNRLYFRNIFMRELK